MISKTGNHWLLLIFAVTALLCLVFAGERAGSLASAQGRQGFGADSGIMVVPIQLERDRFGIAMVDTVAQTLWIYELNSRGPAHNRLRLLAARDWQYDRLLKQYNTAEPKPEQVKMILENFGRQPEQQREQTWQNTDIIIKESEPNSNRPEE